jgi:putative oxidoreductase
VRFSSRRTGRAWVQRSFSTFAPGWPGVGLLVLRTALGIPLLVEGTALLADWRDTASLLIVVALISVAAGVALQLGYSVGRGAIAGAATVIAVHFSSLNGERLNLFSSRIACFLAMSIAIALVFLGPGAFSIDARRFGWREIVIPPRSTPD